ncbi:MAG TPA: glycerol-3-phosphate dehydrogenase/oxidase [Anaerolineaceae bacterium]|nr:glycerol-3-phosphate dehydrogenase/oxidase [Anaerolineaceae bacterium]
MWGQGWREQVWSELSRPWDIIIVGGGITGAGIFRLASKTGLRVLLVESNDFAYGTSSRSSKLVHGGFRYLFNRQFNVTGESVREREWLLREARNLVTPLPFILPNYSRYHIHTRKIDVGVAIYDLLAPKWHHRRLSIQSVLQAAPGINPDGLLAGFEYGDAAIDDARLVIRVLREAVRSGGYALNYTRAEGLLRTQDGRVRGVVLRDVAAPGGPTVEAQASVVINATGPWTDGLRSELGAQPRLRKLRGSHLVFSRERFPLERAVTLFHPVDRRAMFAIPWEGVTLLGTTDIDHPAELEQAHPEPFATQQEIDYLLDAGRFLFPGLGLQADDMLSTFAGLRPIIRSGTAASPSKESRAHDIWVEDGLVTITGGKLTIFRIMATQVMRRVASLVPQVPLVYNRRIFEPLPYLFDDRELPLDKVRYLSGRYAAETPDLIAAAAADELSAIAPRPNLWAELRWAARQEGVIHLDDLLLRRVRLGMLLPSGAMELMPRIRKIAQPELGWSDARWEQEEQRYRTIWAQSYSPAPGNKPQDVQAAFRLLPVE